MDTVQHAALRVRAGCSACGCDVRWSQRDSTHIAVSVEFPELTCAWSSRAAIDGLEDKIRATLAAEPSRTEAV
ncbi:hypothetical protein [Nocardia sp. NPDC004604]|uniref:hypothetical protein n=1 Tax=Nocardia sp. NPDC004604 TaxID=3157013 RepID=UPI0033AEE035